MKQLITWLNRHHDSTSKAGHRGIKPKDPVDLEREIYQENVVMYLNDRNEQEVVLWR